VCVAECFSAHDIGRHFAAMGCKQRPESCNHVGKGKQAAVFCRQLGEIRDCAGHADLGEDRVQGSDLVFGPEHRTADQPQQVIALGEQRFHRRQIRFHGLQSIGFMRQFKQCGGVSVCNTGSFSTCVCHVTFTLKLGAEMRQDRQVSLRTLKKLDVFWN